MFELELIVFYLTVINESASYICVLLSIGVGDCILKGWFSQSSYKRYAA